MKKLIFIVLPILLIGGGVVGAAMMGVIQIPGLSPAKKKGTAAALYAEKKEEPLAQKPVEEPEKPAEAAAPNLDKGREELAKVWEEMEPASIVQMTEKWPEPELAQQLRFLEAEKTAAILSAIATDKPERASKLAKELQALGAAATQES